MRQNTKVIFFGSSEYCLSIIESLRTHFDLIAVVTKPGLVKNWAASQNIPFFTPADKKKLSALAEKISELKPDIAIVADYGLIIPKVIFDIPKYKTLNIHFSKLPKLRGASPVQYTILLGEKSAWISVILMDEGLDTGDIVWQKSFDFAQDKEYHNETSESLYRKLFQHVSAELPVIIDDYITGKLIPQKQDPSEATFTRMFNRNDGFVPFEMITDAISGNNKKIRDYKDKFLSLTFIESLSHCNIVTFVDRAVRTLSPWPGVWTEIEMKQFKKRLKILKAHIENERLILDLVQLEGKKPVTWKQFREGYPKLELTFGTDL